MTEKLAIVVALSNAMIDAGLSATSTEVDHIAEAVIAALPRPSTADGVGVKLLAAAVAWMRSEKVAETSQYGEEAELFLAAVDYVCAGSPHLMTADAVGEQYGRHVAWLEAARYAESYRDNYGRGTDGYNTWQIFVDLCKDRAALDSEKD